MLISLVLSCVSDRSTYRNPHNPTLSVLRTTDEDSTKQQSHGAQQTTHAKEELCPSRNFDP